MMKKLKELSIMKIKINLQVSLKMMRNMVKEVTFIVKIH